MSKMNIIDLQQDSKEWLEWREKGVTASDIPIILGLSPYKTIWQLWAEKTGVINVPDLSGNPNVRKGIKLEDEARQYAENRYKTVLLPVCAESIEFPFLRASFDGVDEDDIPHEFKVPSDKVWDEIQANRTHSSTYKMYEAQVLAQCVVANVSTGKLVFFKQDNQPLDFTVSLSQAMRLEIIDKAMEFWEMVKTNTPPTLDPARDWFIPCEGNAKFAWDANADEWRQNHYRITALKEELKSLEKEQKVTQSKLLTLMGDFLHADAGGVKVTRFTKKGLIDYKSFLEAKFPNEDINQELESYRKNSRSEVRFSKSEDELVIPKVDDVITPVKAAYF